MMRIVLLHVQPTRFRNMLESLQLESPSQSLRQHTSRMLGTEDGTLVALSGDYQAYLRNP